MFTSETTMQKDTKNACLHFHKIQIFSKKNWCNTNEINGSKRMSHLQELEFVLSWRDERVDHAQLL